MMVRSEEVFKILPTDIKERCPQFLKMFENLLVNENAFIHHCKLKALNKIKFAPFV
jgi:hypothetical protein